MKINRSNCGFTLTELLVVCVIVAVLISVMIPSYRRITQKVEAVKCAANLRIIHNAMMMFYTDYHFFPLGYVDYYDPDPGSKWSPIRQRYEWTYKSGCKTQWQIELAPYIGEGNVLYFLYDPDNRERYYSSESWAAYARTLYANARTAPAYEYSWRLPVEYRCPGYTRKMSDHQYEYVDNHNTTTSFDFYGYCYNQLLATGNGSKTQTYTFGIDVHKGRDPRLIVTDYAPPNSPANTMFFFCSRWGTIKKENSYTKYDITGLSRPTDSRPYFVPRTGAPYGIGGLYAGVAAGIHNGRDNCLFADGHIESLTPTDLKDGLRMNKTWHRPLPKNFSNGCFYSTGFSGIVAIIFDDNTGKPAGAMFGSGTWIGTPPAANYNWDY